MYSLKVLAKNLGACVRGDSSVSISRLATLKNAGPGHLSFLTNKKYLEDLKATQASAVLLTKEFVDICPTNSIILNNPYLALAKIAALFDRSPKLHAGVHSSALIAASAIVDKSSSIGPNVVIGNNVILGKDTIINANCVILDNSSIGKKTEIKSNVTIHHDVCIGNDCIIHANSVIGSDGFGNAKDNNGKWVKVPHIGKVIIGNNVEIGASTSIDRGTIDDTVISDGVRIDNQVQIAHNVTIGENTAVAASTGIAGSVDIGRNCLLGGQVGISGHLKICDDVLLSASSKVSKSIKKPGFYATGFNARPHMEWKRISARILRIKHLMNRVKLLEQKFTNYSK